MLHIGMVESDEYLSELKADARYFVEWAKSIHERSAFGKKLFVQSPLYPYLLAGLDRISPEPLHLMRVLQSVVSAVTVVLIALMGQRATKDRRLGMLAGSLAVVYGPFVHYASLILKETLAIGLFSGFILCSLIASDEDRRRWWGAAGLTLGVFWLVRANAPLLAFPVLVWILWKSRAAPTAELEHAVGLGRRAGHAAVFVAGMLLAVLPLMLRNVLVTGQFALTLASGGSNFYVGNNPDATGLYYALPGVSADPRFEAADLVKAAEHMAGRPLSDAEASDYFVKQAVQYIVGQPLAWFRLMLKKALIYWNAFEIPDNYDYSFYAEQLPWLRYALQFSFVATLGLAGLLVTVGTRSMRLLRWETGMYMLSTILFYVNARFRVVMVPLLLVGSAVSLGQIHASARGKDWRRLLLMLLLVGACYGLTQTSVCDGERGRVEASSWAWYGKHLLAERQFAKAQQAFSRAVAANPNDAYAHHGLGELAALAKDYPTAAYQFVEALRLGAEDSEIYRKITSAYLAAGDRQAALNFLEQATRLEPEKEQPRELLRLLGAQEPPAAPSAQPSP